MIRHFFTVCLLSFFVSLPVFAEGISTHILDLSSGVGGKDVPVVLETKDKNGAWVKVASAVTDTNGRIKSFGESLKVETGVYKLVFDMSKYSGSSARAFFPEINVIFQISDKKTHYHVPVVVSPYGYSTYRGN